MASQPAIYYDEHSADGEQPQIAYSLLRVVEQTCIAATPEQRLPIYNEQCNSSDGVDVHPLQRVSVARARAEDLAHCLDSAGQSSYQSAKPSGYQAIIRACFKRRLVKSKIAERKQSIGKQQCDWKMYRKRMQWIHINVWGAMKAARKAKEVHSLRLQQLFRLFGLPQVERLQ